MNTHGTPPRNLPQKTATATPARPEPQVGEPPADPQTGKTGKQTNPDPHKNRHRLTTKLHRTIHTAKPPAHNNIVIRYSRYADAYPAELQQPNA